jgi:NADPH-dependent 2,4-dienoyl-CoA reductase/sulfur reductase-like enzyme
MGAGGVQALVKSGMPIAGKRVILAGTGPLLLAVAAALARKGARIVGIFEQVSFGRMLLFGTRLLKHPSKLREGLGYGIAIGSTAYRSSSWVLSAHGESQLKTVTVSTGGVTRTLNCDFLGCGFHLVPNLELPKLLGCRIDGAYVHVNELQQTSVPDVYCAGEPTGIGGLEKSLCEGEIAGLAATDRPATHLYARRNRYARFARELDHAFGLRSELKMLPKAETFVCRCEDVSYHALESMRSWREAKLHTRCGMGACQGRICGAASEYLFGWDASHARPPIFPARVGSLIASPQQTGQGDMERQQL